MKTTLQLLIITFFFILTGCSKTPDAPALTAEEKVAKLLTGEGNKYWHLKSISLNNVPQTLSANQLAYTKTYTLTPGETLKGTFTESDYTSPNGTWKMVNAATLREDFLTVGGSFIRIDWDIENISENKLTMSYVYQPTNIKTEHVYYAY